MALIQLRNICKSYPLGDSELPILKNINLQIDSGEFVAIMGPSGSGKSTLMNILGCLDKPSSGEYILNGKNVENLSSDNLADIRIQTIGFVFQGFNLLSRMSAVENVELPMIYSGIDKDIRRQKAEKALTDVGLKERMYHQPNQLSGGQQQRVAIARAIVNQAPIIFADEPTGNLDTKMSVEIMHLFQQLNRDLKRTLILVTHEEDIARFANRIIHIVDGEISIDEKVIHA
jgi:putative ABC transport system ATP-binding protein